MTLLVTIVTNGLSGIFLRPSVSTPTSIGVTPQVVYCINLGGQGGILRPSFLVTPLPFLFFLLLLPSLLGDLSAIRALRSYGLLFLGPGLMFLDLWVLYWLTMGIGFGYGRPTTLKVMLIAVASIETRPKGGLSFGVNGFFNYFFKAIEFSSTLLYFNSH